MGAMPNEPSMEEILSSIKRIIAEEDGAPPPRAPRRSTAQVPPESTDMDAEEDHVLELTDALPGESESPDRMQSAPAQEEPAMDAPAKPAKTESAKTDSKPRQRPAAASAAPAASVLSPDSAQAARDSLVNLSKLLVTPEDGQSNTLEGLVREMLRPMLKEWLDANLPGLVEGMVKREIDRITGRV
jgi:cell pole-organizing protein PopZ